MQCVRPVSARASSIAPMFAVIVVAILFLPSALEARCKAYSAQSLSTARSVVPVAATCIDGGGALQAPIRPEGGGAVCDDATVVPDDWPMLPGDGVNVWRVDRATSTEWSFGVYSNGSVDSSIVCTLDQCITTDVPIVLQSPGVVDEVLRLLSEYIADLSSAIAMGDVYGVFGLLILVPVTLALPAVVGVFTVRTLFSFGVHLYTKFCKSITLEQEGDLKRIRVTSEILVFMMLLWLQLMIQMAPGC